MNQSELDAISVDRQKARENVCHDKNGFFSDWSRERYVIFTVKLTVNFGYECKSD